MRNRMAGLKSSRHPICAALGMSAFGVKRTSRRHQLMSAFDPKRTLVVLTAQPLPVRSFDAIRWPHPWFVSRVAVIRDPRIGPGIGQFGVSAFMPRRLQDLVVFAAPGVFVVLWASGI